MDSSDSNPNVKLALAVKEIQKNVIEEETTEISIPGLSRQDVLVGTTVNILLEDFGLDISHATAESRVKETIQEMMVEDLNEEYDDPVSRFREAWPEITGSKPSENFTILIPLPIAGQEGVLPGEIAFNGHTLNRISSSMWKEFEQQSQTTEAEDTDGYPPNLNVFIEGTDLQGVTSSEYTFWRFDEQGIDTNYVIQRMNSVLRIFLGQLSFVADNRIPVVVDHTLNKVRAGARTVFQPPPFYLIFRDSVFHRIHPHVYPVKKPIPRIQSGFYFEEIIDGFPDFGRFEEVEESIYLEDSSVHVRPVQATLGAAFRTLGRAMRETDPESMFLWLYRTLEHITFTKYAESKEPLLRALRLLNADSDPQVQQFVDVVKDRRNTIVHDGTDTYITQTELNLLKSLSISTIERVGEIAKSSETDEIVTCLVTTDIQKEIENAVEERNEKKEGLEKIGKKINVLEEVRDLKY